MKTGQPLCCTAKCSGDGGYRSPYLPHAKRALYHLSYIPVKDGPKRHFLRYMIQTTGLVVKRAYLATRCIFRPKPAQLLLHQQDYRPKGLPHIISYRGENRLTFMPQGWPLWSRPKESSILWQAALIPVARWLWACDIECGPPKLRWAWKRSVASALYMA